MAENLTPVWAPNQVFLFTGHMVDRPDSVRVRFPEVLAPAAGRRIAEYLAEWEAGQQDLAICGGACGGDLLFAEAALARGLRLEIRLPLPEPEFLAESVEFAPGWKERYFRVAGNARCEVTVLPAAEAGDDRSVWERNNLWMGEAALQWGAERVRFLCLWDGNSGYGPGGTADMVQWAEENRIPVRQICPQELGAGTART
mgnify:CR=1 FL=1